ncbi:MAG: hypothetical protein KKI14_03145, partial [Nanoarchaeota archaeon]|nr:hypothetical protein [Nanoarchaeota archaeon]
MKIKIVAEDNRRGKIEIPITEKEIAAMYDVGFFFDPNFIKDLKVNKIKDDFYSICVKFQYLSHDVIHDGKMYEIDSKTGKTKLWNRK